MPVPPSVTAVRDTICAVLRDDPHVVDTETVAARLPKQTRLLTRDGDGLCADDHAPLRRHSCAELLHCFGNSGHVIAWRMSTPEVYQHLQALHMAGYVQKFVGTPTRWFWIEAALAGPHRQQVELFEQAEFAALAVLAGDPGPQR